MIKVIKLIGAGLGIVALGEGAKFAWNHWLRRVAMIQGHSYTFVFNYTKDPPAPISQQLAQSVLSAAPGGSNFNVLAANMTPGASSGIRQFTLMVELTGATGSYPATDFTTGWPVTFGTVTLGTTTDTGPAQGVT